ncbi:MAG: cytochrome c-type biogenesis protein [Casimicrobiaceae bacterium]
MTRRGARVAQPLLLCLVAIAASATTMDPPATDIAFDARIRKLEGELRCLVCQNQTLADSNADLAGDLRREVRTLAGSGKSDDEIKAYLVARYGDFVLYDPPVKTTTWLLWGGPFALLVGGALLWVSVSGRRERNSAAMPPDAEAQSRARSRLEGVDAS